MIKVTYDSKTDIRRTLVVNAKQYIHDHGDEIVTAVNKFFEEGH